MTENTGSLADIARGLATEAQGGEPVDPLRAIANDLAADHRSILRSLDPAAAPAAAQDLDLARSVGLPRDVVARNRDQAEALRPAPQLDPILGVTAGRISDPEVGPAVADDIVALNDFERVIRHTSQGWARGWRNMRIAEIQHGAMWADPSPAELEELEELRRAEELEPDYGLGFWGQWPGVVAEMAPISGSVAVSGLAGGAVGAAAGAALTFPARGSGAGLGFRIGYTVGALTEAYQLEAGLAFEEYSQTTDRLGFYLDRDVARGAAVAVGVVNAGLEKLGLDATIRAVVPGADKLLGMLSRQGAKKLLRNPTIAAAFGRFGRRVTAASLTEGLTEGLQELVTTIGGVIAGQVADGDYPTPHTAEVISRIVDSAIKGAQGGAGLSAAGGAVTLPIDYNLAQHQQQRRALFEELGRNATDSKTLKRLPSEWQQHVRDVQAAHGVVEHVYVAPGPLRRFFQGAGVTEEEIARDMSRTWASLEDAELTGAAVAIPLEEFSTYVAPAANYNDLVEDLKWDPEQPSPAETAALEAARAEYAAISGETTVGPAPGEGVYDAVLQELTDSGRSQQVAELEAQVWQQWYATAAQRMGTTAEALYAERRLRVRSAEIERVQDRLDAVINRVRRGDYPADSEAFGPNLSEWLGRQGGIRDEGGELAELGLAGAETGSGPLSRENGVPLRDAMVMASEAGYLPGRDVSQLAESDLLDALVADTGGERVYRLDAQDDQVVALGQDMTWLSETLEGLGITSAKLQTMSNQEVRKLIDEGAVEYAQSAVSLRRSAAHRKRYGFRPGLRVRQIAELLEARAKQVGHVIARDDHSEEAEKKIARWMVEDLKLELSPDAEGASAMGWYTTQYQQALDELAAVHPELASDQNARDLMTMLVAISSDGKSVQDNWKFAERMYRDRKEQGAIDRRVALQFGDRRASLAENINAVESLLEEFGSADKVRDFLLAESTVQELRALMRAQGRKFETDYRGEVRLPMAALVFGEKLGAFYANLMGATGYLTMDRWFARSFNRYRGALVPILRGTEASPTWRGKPVGLARFKHMLGAPEISDAEAIERIYPLAASFKAKNYKRGTPLEQAANTLYKTLEESIEDAPNNASDRSFMISTVARAQRSLKRAGYDITIADLQAMLWYFEKRLYNELGSSSLKDVSYADAVKVTVAAQQQAKAAAGGGAGNHADGPQRPPSDSRDGTAGTSPPHLLRQDERGWVTFRDEGRSVEITLEANADLSTFLHESGHAFLEHLTLWEREGRLTPQQRDDLAALRKHLGAKPGEPWTVEQHELFARSWETYLGEGTAPSVGLRDLFRRVRGWVLTVYRDLRRLNAPLSDEVRAVFDRMLATDEELEARQARGEMPTALTPEVLDQATTAAEAEALIRVHQRAADEWSARQDERVQADARAAAAKIAQGVERKIRKQVRQDVLGQRVYNVISWLRTGRTLSGRQALEYFKTGQKLSKDAVLLLFPDVRVFDHLRGMYTTGPAGVHPDDVAAEFGYTNGTEMIEAILRAPTRKQWEQAEVASRLAEEFRADPAEETQAKVAAAMSDAAGDAIAAELALLSERTGIRETRAAARETAYASVSFERLVDIKPGRYKIAAEQAARESTFELGKGNRPAAQAAKSRQLLNYYFWRASTEALESSERIYRYLRSFEKPAKAGRLGKVPGGYLEAIYKLLEGVEIKRVPTRGLERRKTLQAWIAEREADEEVVLVPEYLRLEAELQNYRLMSLPELEGLRDAVKNLEHLATVKGQILINNERRDFRDSVNQAAAVMAEGRQAREEPVTAQPGALERLRRVWSGWAADLSKMEFVARWLDNGADTGLNHQLLFQPIADAQAAKADELRRIDTALREMFARQSKDQRARMQSRVRFMGEDRVGSEVIAAALNWGNRSNQEKLVRGRYADLNRAELQAAIQATDAELRSWMRSEDWALVQEIWDLVETMWPKLAEAYRQATGLTPPKIKPTPIKVGGETYRGGYYPLRYDTRRSHKMAEHEQAAQAKAMFENIYQSASAKTGATEARTGFRAPLLLSLDVLPSHLAEVAHFATHYQAVAQTSRLIKDEQYRQAVTGKLGVEAYRGMLPWLQAVAADGRSAERPSSLDAKLRAIRSGATMVAMGYKLSSAIMQGFGMFTTVDAIGAKYTARGILATLATPARLRSSWRDTMDRSGEMRALLTGFDRDIKATVDAQFGQPGVWSGVKRHAFILMQYLQGTVNVATWQGAWLRALDEGKTEDQAQRYADSMVRVSQSAGGVKDLAAIQRGGEGARLFTMFYSYFSVLANRERDIVRELRDERHRRNPPEAPEPDLLDDIAAGRYGAVTPLKVEPQTDTGLERAPRALAGIPYASARMAWLILLPVLFESLMRGEGPDDDEGYVEWYTARALLYAAASLPFIRDVASGLVGDYGYSMSPAGSMVGSGVRGATAALQAVREGEPMTESEFRAALTGAGIAFRLPTGQAWATGDYLYHLSRGEIERPVRDPLLGVEHRR